MQKEKELVASLVLNRGKSAKVHLQTLSASLIVGTGTKVERNKLFKYLNGNCV